MSAHERQQVIEHERFGETSCLHVYIPEPTLLKKLEGTDLIRRSPKFFMENDMIVFDQSAHNGEGELWAGGGGAWEQRMVDGDHCGACFIEDDPRQRHLDPTMVWDLLIRRPAPELQVFRRN